jgi:hypothetical protein
MSHELASLFMRLEARKYIYDNDQAAELLHSIVSGKSLRDYLADQTRLPELRRDIANLKSL